MKDGLIRLASGSIPPYLYVGVRLMVRQRVVVPSIRVQFPYLNPIIQLKEKYKWNKGILYIMDYYMGKVCKTCGLYYVPSGQWKKFNNNHYCPDCYNKLEISESKNISKAKKKFFLFKD